MSSAFTRRLPILLLITLLVLLVAYLQWPKTNEKQQKHQRVVSVKTTPVTKAQYRDTIEAIATTRANEQVFITTKYSDLVDEIFFQDGDIVKKGDILVRLNNREEAAKVKELQANLAESVAQLNRIKGLYKKKATSKALVDQQDAKTKAISAQLLSAKIKLNDFSIKAPFSGILGFREISQGALVNVGDVITSLDDLSEVKVDFTIAERFLTTVAVGQTIEASSIAYKDTIFIGTISSVDSRVDSKTRTLKVRAKIPNPELKLRAGMLLNVKIIRDIEQILQLPESAIIPIDNDHFVFIVKEGKAQRKKISIGRRKQGIVEVVSGLQVSDEVVIEGALKLRDGSQVKVLEQTL